MSKGPPTRKLAVATKKLPPALARRAATLSAQKRGRLLREARSLLALIRRRRGEIAGSFYDIGVALTRLKDRGMIAALDCRSFAEVCESKAGISATVGTQLVELASRMTREQALAMGQSKALAMIALAEATPETDTAVQLFNGARSDLPRVRKARPRKASVREITRAARRIREAQATSKPKRGRTTSPEERALAAGLEEALRALGIDRAAVTADH